MIKLDVCEYCQYCLEFEPVVMERPNYLFEDGARCGSIGDTIVQCENRFKCENLYNNLKKETNND